MSYQGRVLESGTLRREFLLTGEETDGRLVEMRVTYAAESPFPPPHFHPSQTETFVVEEGEMLVRKDGEGTALPQGETLVVPAGSVHQMRNGGDTPAVVNWKVEPALRTEEFFAVAHELENGGLLERMLMVSEYRDVFRLALAPRPVVGAVVAVLGGAARIAGHSLPEVH